MNTLQAEQVADVVLIGSEDDVQLSGFQLELIAGGQATVNTV